jgi:hypothetical protein
MIPGWRRHRRRDVAPDHGRASRAPSESLLGPPLCQGPRGGFALSLGGCHGHRMRLGGRGTLTCGPSAVSYAKEAVSRRQLSSHQSCAALMATRQRLLIRMPHLLSDNQATSPYAPDRFGAGAFQAERSRGALSFQPGRPARPDAHTSPTSTLASTRSTSAWASSYTPPTSDSTSGRIRVEGVSGTS